MNYYLRYFIKYLIRSFGMFFVGMIAGFFLRAFQHQLVEMLLIALGVKS